tara:strand:- start:1215 stop:1508 length:294 start_codon:yes stop_codon:yes gene_type:complete
MNKRNFTRNDFIKNLSNQTGFSLNLSKKLINDLIYILHKSIKSGNLNIKNLGSFKLLKKKERLGRNPKTKEEYLIKSRKSVSFTASKKILDIVNKNK